MVCTRIPISAKASPLPGRLSRGSLLLSPQGLCPSTWRELRPYRRDWSIVDYSFDDDEATAVWSDGDGQMSKNPDELPNVQLER
jgi:hypothetical protein